MNSDGISYKMCKKTKITFIGMWSGKIEVQSQMSENFEVYLMYVNIIKTRLL